MRFGVDLGGTKIELAALDDQGEMVYRHRVDTPKGDYAATVAAIVSLVREAEQHLQVEASVGVGIPGAVSTKTGRVKNANSTWLIGEDLQGDLSHALQREVRLANDANCFTLSEAMDGSAKGADCVFGVIIGTGCGGGIVINGQILNGLNSIAGEWGHNPLPWTYSQGLECYCGLSGCNETYLSGSGLERHYQQRAGQCLSAKQIIALALEQQDNIALELLNDYVTWLAKGLASVINMIDPDVIVLGGGLSNIDYLYQEVPKVWDNWIFSNDKADTLLVKPRYGDSSGVRGAAWLHK